MYLLNWSKFQSWASIKKITGITVSQSGGIVAFILYLDRYYRRIYKYINDILLMNFFLAQDNYLHLYPKCGQEL